MNIVFSEERMPGDHVVKKMIQAGELCVREEGLPEDKVMVSVSFVETEEIRDLNRTYRGVDAVTDVLSFPQFESLEDAGNMEIISLGDVVICGEQALIQADEFGHSAERELVYLFVHSMFHLLGYDHMEEDEKDEMREKEELIMEKVGLIR